MTPFITGLCTGLFIGFFAGIIFCAILVLAKINSDMKFWRDGR